MTTTLEDRHKKRHQKEKQSSVDETNLQRSKTFVNLLFKKERKEKNLPKSPSRHADRGEITATLHGQRLNHSRSSLRYRNNICDVTAGSIFPPQK